jgi:hypothetical protein
MNHNEEVPDFLGGLGDMLPADVLKKVNELLEQLHRKDKDHQGSHNTIVYVAPGAQYVGTIEKQYVEPVHSPLQRGPHPSPLRGERESLPDVLATPEAMALWEKAQRAGYVDEHYQPLLSRTQAALLADAMAKRMGIKEKWKVFEALWNRKNMYKDFYYALNQKQSLVFQDKLKAIL